MNVRGCSLLAAMLAVPATLGAQAGGWTACYDVTLEGWNRPIGGDSVIFTPPPRILLDSVRSADLVLGAGELRVRPAPASPPSRHRFAAWMPVGADSVRMLWSTGFAGVQIRAARTPDGFRGRAESHIDVMGTPPYTADAIGVRVDCASPMPPQHASWRRFPARVPLESGDTLTLGAPVPERIVARAERDADRRYVVRARPTGIFAGATHARVQSADGIIRAIDVLYDPSQSLDALYARLVEAIGPPPSDVRPTADRAVFWSGRDDSFVSLWPSTTLAGEREVVVSLYSRTR